MVARGSVVPKGKTKDTELKTFTCDETAAAVNGRTLKTRLYLDNSQKTSYLSRLQRMISKDGKPNQICRAATHVFSS